MMNNNQHIVRTSCSPPAVDNNNSSSTQQQDLGKNGSNNPSYNTNRLNARQQMNIGVLKRKDKFITTIHSTFDHVVFYKYQDNSSWDKLEVEGAMFIVERNEPKFPKYRIVVMNRKSSDDFRQDITKDLELEVHHPFVFYRTKGRIKGIWFYKPLQCIEFNDLIVSLKEKAYGKSETEQNGSKNQLTATSIAQPPSIQSSSSSSLPSQLFNTVDTTTYQPSSSLQSTHHHQYQHHHQIEQPPSSDASSLLKNMLGIGGGAGVAVSSPVFDTNPNSNNNNSNNLDVGNNYHLDEESLIREHFFNSSNPVMTNNQQQQQVTSSSIEPEYSSVLAQECIQQFGRRKFVTKEMFINQLMFTLESNKDFSDSCYNQYCQFIADEQNKQSGNRC